MSGMPLNALVLCSSTFTDTVDGGVFVWIDGAVVAVEITVTVGEVSSRIDGIVIMVSVGASVAVGVVERSELLA